MAAIKKQILYKEIERDLALQMRSQQMQSGDALPSEGEIAEKFQVSRMTAKLALNSLEERGVISRIARKGSYVKDLSLVDGIWAGSRAPTARFYAAVVTCVMDDFFAEIISELQAQLAPHGYELVLRDSRNDPALEGRHLEELSANPDIAGIMVLPCGNTACSDALMRLKLDGYPVVVLDRVYREVELDSVNHDNFGGASRMTEYLISKGHKRIGVAAFIGENTVVSAVERYDGFLKTMMNYHLPIRQDYVFAYPEYCGAEEEQQAFLAYLRRVPEITAVFCVNDVLARKMLYAAQELNIAVPAQLSIGGFLDHQLLSLLNIGITTMRQPILPLAQQAVRLLLARKETPNRAYEHVIIDTPLIERQSVREIYTHHTI